MSWDGGGWSDQPGQGQSWSDQDKQDWSYQDWSYQDWKNPEAAGGRWRDEWKHEGERTTWGQEWNAWDEDTSRTKADDAPRAESSSSGSRGAAPLERGRSSFPCPARFSVELIDTTRRTPLAARKVGDNSSTVDAYEVTSRPGKGYEIRVRASLRCVVTASIDGVCVGLTEKSFLPLYGDFHKPKVFKGFEV